VTIDYCARYMGKHYKPTWTAALCILDGKGQRLARYPLGADDPRDLLRQVKAIKTEWETKAKA
jgi:hypothetical protein